jgi:hypothetical protein
MSDDTKETAAWRSEYTGNLYLRTYIPKSSTFFS